MLGVCLKPREFDPKWDFVELQFEKSVSYNADWKYSGPRFGVHAPYYVTLASPKPQKADYAVHQLIEAGKIAHKLNSDIVVARAGFYSKQSPEETLEKVVISCEEVMKAIDVPLGIETQARQSQFGSVEEVLELAERVGIVPVFNLGAMKKRGDFDLSVLKHMANPYVHFDESLDLEELAAALPEKYTLVGETVSAAEAMETILSPF